jgi:CRISPR type I-E-associated protein CasB/Cse2
MTSYQIENEAVSFLAFLRNLSDDRGAMANLRCVFTPARAPRAWPLLARVGALGDRTKEAVAGFYALHPNPYEGEPGNMGDTCRELARKHNAFESRFQRLLGCNRGELINHLRRVVLAAKAQGVPVD